MRLMRTDETMHILFEQMNDNHKEVPNSVSICIGRA